MISNHIVSTRLRITGLWLAVAGAFWFARCAHPVTPEGGPKDMKPPEFIGAVPPNYSTHFIEKKIEIEFDEFIQLKDIAKEVFTSPPMVEKPELIVRGKTLVVNITEALRDSMTYMIYFGSAIADITESNPLKGFSYVFSTGPWIDSLTIGGKVLNAKDLKPVENILLSVYSMGQDTLPLDSMPLYIPPLSAIRTGSDGSFVLTNLPGGKYLVFALEDLNSNFYFDLPNERIAFLDSLVTPEYIGKTPDTTGKGMKSDTTAEEIKSGIQLITAGKPLHPVTLYLFEEFDSVQRMLSSSFTEAGSIQFAFRMPVKDLEIKTLNFTPEGNWKTDEYNDIRDTLNIWPHEFVRDTFQLLITVDSAISDTLRLVRKKHDQAAAGRKKTTRKKGPEYKLNTLATILQPGKDLLMTFREPVVHSDFTGFLIMSSSDTLIPMVEFTDSIHRKITIHHDWKENEIYRLVIPDSVITVLSGAENDSITETIRTKPLSDYGTLIMDYKTPPGSSPYIAELLNDKDAVLQRNILKSAQKITYKYLNPGAYRIRITHDVNNNGRWDTGNYRKKTQPEEITFYQKEITVRPNWELQEEWQPGL